MPINRTRAFTREELDNLGLPDNGELAVLDEERDTGRWTEHRVVIARIDDRLWELRYQVGLTENQECDTWYDADPITATEVELYDEQITVTRYRPLEDCCGGGPRGDCECMHPELARKKS